MSHDGFAVIEFQDLTVWEKNKVWALGYPVTASIYQVHARPTSLIWKMLYNGHMMVFSLECHRDGFSSYWFGYNPEYDVIVMIKCD